MAFIGDRIASTSAPSAYHGSAKWNSLANALIGIAGIMSVMVATFT
ncbi:hypothetical protein [Variovorax sp. ZT5P30]